MECSNVIDISKIKENTKKKLFIGRTIDRWTEGFVFSYKLLQSSFRKWATFKDKITAHYRAIKKATATVYELNRNKIFSVETCQ